MPDIFIPAKRKQRLSSRAMDTIVNWLNGRASQDDKLHHMRRDAKALDALAADRNTELEHEELRPGKRRRREVDNWLKEVNDTKIQLGQLEQQLGTFSISEAGCINQAAKLAVKIGELIQQGSFPRGLTLDHHGSSSVALVTTNVKVSDHKYEDNKRRVLSWLTEYDAISIIGVYGPGGVGKTTLLKDIHNELLENSKSSGHICWVSVSHGTSVSMLQDKIAEALNMSHLFKEENVIHKAAMLSYDMRRKNVVLILDDMWQHYSLDQVGIPVGENNCKLILTTRSLDVCRKMRCQEIVKVEPLSQGDAWKLFAKGLGVKIPSDIKDIAQLVAAECAGLPLGVIIMAGSMRGVHDIQEWHNALEELQNSNEGQADMERDVFPVLKLSYDRLKDQKLRQCFLLCALYPKGTEILRDELITLFRSEGLLDGIQSWDKQLDKAHSMLNKLENACLLEKGSSRHVKMHSLIREMAIRITTLVPRFMIAAGAELRRIPSGRRWTFGLEKVSLMQNSLSEIQPGTIPMCPCLSTLLLQRNPFTKLPDSFFQHMKGLKVLNLSYTGMKRLPRSISDLQSLSALLLDFCARLHFVPSLVKLINLRDLSLTFCWSMKDVPHGMEHLISLKFLDLEGSKDLCHLLGGSLSALSNIQCLELDPDVQTISGDDLVKLRSLEKLEGCRVSDVSTFNRYAETQHFQQLNSYEFVIGTGEYKRIDYGKPSSDKTTLNKASRILVLCSRSLREGEGRLFILPKNIQNLQIHNCDFSVKSLIDALPSLYSLPVLTKILVRRCRVVEFIWPSPSSFESEQARFLHPVPTIMSLQCLQQLILTDLQDFRGLVEEGVALPQGAFANLKILVVKFCPLIKKLFTPSPLRRCLDNLQELEVEGCEELEEIIATDSNEDNEQERSIKVEGNIDEDNVVTVFPNLMDLQLRRLPKLISICQGGLLGSSSIEQISVEYCAELNKIFKPSLSPLQLRNLKGVTITHCKNLQEIIAKTNSRQKGSITELPNLRALTLDDLPLLTSVFPGRPPTCHSIEQITVQDCPCLRRLPVNIPLFNNGKPLVPLCLQEIRSDREWWESLDWVNPHLKKVLQPLAKLVDADKSSFKIPKELDITENYLKGEASTMGTNNTDIISCLTDPRQKDGMLNPAVEAKHKEFPKFHSMEIEESIVDNLVLEEAHHWSSKEWSTYTRGYGAGAQQQESEGGFTELGGETDMSQQATVEREFTLLREIEELKASNSELRLEIEHLKVDAERAKVEAIERENKLRDELLQLFSSQLTLRQGSQPDTS